MNTTNGAQQAQPIRVMIVDDHPVVRRGIQFALASTDDIVVIAEADSGEEAVRLCQEHQPDVVLMDIMMPGMDGVATTEALKQRCPTSQVLMLTSFQEGQRVREALKAGAIGYLLKDVAIDELTQAVRNAKAGQSTLHRAATAALIQPPTVRPDLTEELTDRQREVLALVAQGYSNQEIGNKLFVSLATVRFHVSTILAKLGASNRAEAAALAVKHNLLQH